MLKNLVYLALFTLFVALLWVGLSIYHNISTSTISTDENIQINPITATFNIKAIDILKKKQSVPVNLSERMTPISPVPATGSGILKPSVSPTITRTVSPTSAPIISPTPVATGSGTLNNAF